MSRLNAHEVFVMFLSLGVLIAFARALGTVWPGGVLAFVLTLGLLGAAPTEWIGVHAIFGAFLVGVAVGDSPQMKAQTRMVIAKIFLNSENRKNALQAKSDTEFLALIKSGV